MKMIVSCSLLVDVSVRGGICVSSWDMLTITGS
jgi:hypothetical protein